MKPVLSQEEIECIRKDPSASAKNWKCLSFNYILSEDFMREFQDRINWDWVSYDYYILSEDFIREFRDRINWKGVCYYQEISEEFIIEFQDKVCWDWISWRQILSKSFIVKFSHKINFKFLVRNKNISEEIKDYCRMFI